MDHKSSDRALRLHDAIASVCPIAGISIGSWDDRGTWRIAFGDGATQQQRESASALLKTFGPFAPSNGDVKAEARRRILAVFPDWKQANMTARGVELQDIWRRTGSWTEQEQAEADALQAAWAWIKAVRSASDVLEAMSPIPGDYTDDKRWPT